MFSMCNQSVALCSRLVESSIVIGKGSEISTGMCGACNSLLIKNIPAGEIFCVVGYMGFWDLAITELCL